MKLFVWDLHGVLEFGNHQAAVDISNQILSNFGHLERFTYEDGTVLYGRKWYEYFEWLLPDNTHDYHLSLQDACFQFSEFDLAIQRQWLKPTTHAWDVLSTIGEKHHQILISNTRSGNLELFLKTLQLEKFFPNPSVALAVDGHAQNAQRTKNDVLSDYLATECGNNEYDEIVIIGDSSSDMRLRDVAGGVTYLYAHPEFSFRDCAADFKIRDLRDVLNHA
jgi:phosphoglycolate phosphatase-like HAD superfamily hydrolase